MAQYRLEHLAPVASDLEQLGTKEKFWFSPMDTEPRLWLFKFSRAGTGEHWSEKCAAELCHLLGIPHAEYELALIDGRYGVISPNMIPLGYRMVMGNEVLHTTTMGYPQPLPPGQSAVRVKEHTVTRVLGCLDNDLEKIHPPVSGYDLKDLNAGDVFCGYLLLDALISNQDRHHENWAIMLNNETGERMLCPTYDHAASLGREMRDVEKTERLTTKDRNRQIPAFVRRARSELFKLKTDKKPLLTVEAFRHAIENRPRAKEHWFGRLNTLTHEDIVGVFNNVPADCISEVSRTFAIEMVLENRRRLLEDES
ncbi:MULTISPECIES: hypothetical protein [Escherichia]|uniref:hypothetical protein n=1 Tax=Escherichia TaxID=561 RepID=UPI0007431B2B|nr:MULTISPECIES: hypothetical protein [Escherichia]EEV6025940.1 hypothetical protein [Escherichia coli]EFA3500007.1 hypothetical protein [Escherichia coli]EFA4352432.1 hypothetical protein [Escherichia coli]EFA6128243.1 hypothetical protein [Escherichia coli]EFC3479471.1 hypothetical protein [Escherichia coli]